MSYDKNNIFAKILRREIPCDVVYEDDVTLAFHDIEPAAKHHVLVIPKGAYVSFDDFIIKAEATEVASFMRSVGEIAKILDVRESGYRLIANHGENAMQTVAHFHIHLLAGEKLGGLLPNDKHLR